MREFFEFTDTVKAASKKALAKTEKMFSQIAPYQHLVKAADNDYLDHDSYVDCYTVKEFNSERVLESAEYLGHIKDEDLAECLEHVRQSPAIKPYLLKKFNL